MMRAYEEIVNFIAAGSTPDDVACWKPSRKSRNRVATLLERAKSGSLSPDEQSELNHYLELEHLMRLAKARARQQE
jgi:hypothetical protein